MRTTIFTLITSFLAFNLFAQAPQKSFTEKLDGIKTSSKELTKNASTDNSSVGQAGEMHTSVPLVNVTSRTMSFPLRLNYSAGITADQKSSSVGLGWVLPIGSITRDYGAYEPDYTALSNEAQMKNEDPDKTSGVISPQEGSIVNPSNNGQALGYNTVFADAMTTPISDMYHVNVPGFISNSFWNNSSSNATDHNWTLSEFERWKIVDAPKTYTISQEFSRINEFNVENCTNCNNSNYFGTNGSFAAAIGILPYVKNGYAFLPSAGSSSGWLPATNEEIVKYEDFGQFTITDENGTVYVFGRGLRGQKYMFSDDPYWSTRMSGGSNNGNFWKIDFIAEWLLTEIHSVDYVDINNNGIADDADGGDWIRFEYTEPTKAEEMYLGGSSANKLDQVVPKYREWSSFSQTDQASSLMRELAYLQKIVTPTQTIDFTISQRFDVDHDFYSKPANKVGNSHYYVDRKYSSTGLIGTEKDFDVVFPVETMKYDEITINSKLINKSIYSNENTVTGKIKLNYADKGSTQELAVSSYLIRDNNNNEKLVAGEEIGKPNAGMVIENYYSETIKRGKTTLLSVDFYGSDLNESDKSSYTFEYGFNPSYDEIHKRAIVNKYFFPSVRQAYPDNSVFPEIIAEYPINYPEKRLSCDGLTSTTVQHTGLSPYEFLIDFPYRERYYRFANGSDGIIESWNAVLPDLTFTEITHPLKPIVDQFGYYLSDNCTNGAQAWSLTKIIYPTGGIVHFEYERGSYNKSYDDTKWKFGENEVPMIKEYNDLAKKRSYTQDDYNEKVSDEGFYYDWDKQKTLTATFEVDLPEYIGIRLKSKTVDDRLNPTVTVNYNYSTGHITSLPSAYVSTCLGGFNSFIMRERRRHEWERLYYTTLMPATFPEFSTTDYDFKMKDVAITNISLDGYTSTHYYDYTEVVFADGSKKRLTYGSINGNNDSLYPTYSVFCTRLAASSLQGGRYVIGGNVNSTSPVILKKEELFANGENTAYSATIYTQTRTKIANKSMKFRYDGGIPGVVNEVVLFNNTFQVYVPINCPPNISLGCVNPHDYSNLTPANYFSNSPVASGINALWSTNLSSGNPKAFVYLNQKNISSSLVLPNATYSPMQYEKWGSYSTKTTKIETNYKGMISSVEYIYHPTGFYLQQEKTESVYASEKYITKYEYAFETYSALTTKFSNLNLLRLPSKTTTYLNSVAAANALSASVMTYDYLPTVPKMLDTYQYETANINHATGTFTLPSFDPTQPEWRISESDVYLYNRTANPVSTRSNQLFTKTVVGNGLNTIKAVISSPERKFDATYTGFEDLSNKAPVSIWNSSSYLEEDWLTQEVAITNETGKISQSGVTQRCVNSSTYTAGASTIYHIISVNQISDLEVGDQVQVSFDYSGSTTTFTTNIVSIHQKSELENVGLESQSLNHFLCFSSVPPIPAIDPIGMNNIQLFTNVVVSKNNPVYRLSSAYSRTGNYSYKLPTIRNTDDTPKKTPIRPVKIDQLTVTTPCIITQQGVSSIPKSSNTLPEECYWDYQASVWLKYDKDIVLSTPTSETVPTQSDDVAGDAIYRRGEVSTTTNQGIKIICDVWNSSRTQVVEQFVFYAQNINTAWQQFTVDIPIYKGAEKWLDVYVQNDLTQPNVTFQNAKSVYADDILVYPKDAKYNYTVYDKFGNSTYTVNNDDVFTQTIYDVKGRLKSNRNAYGRTVSEINYFDHPNWLTAHNHLTQRQWIANGHYNDTRFYIDGFGKTKQAVVADVERNSRMVSETNVFNNKGQVYRSYKPYALQGGALDTKYDGGFATQTAALYGSDYAYTEVTFETKPDEKVSAVSAPRTNSESAIVSTQSDYVNTTTLTYPIFINSNTYPAGTLIVHELINPLGKKTKTYIDNLGRVLMEEHEIGYDHQQNADGSITILNTGFDYARTWFVYDGAGRIIATYDPSGKKTEYFYNSLGLVVKSISPDKGMSEMRYDKYGQVRFVKNARDYEAIQANNFGCDQFKYMKYDKWGRVTETGVLTVAPNSLGGSGGNQPFPTDEFFDEYAKINNQEFPSTTQKLVQVHTKTTYDGMRITYNSSQVLVQTTLSDHTFNTTTYLYTEGKTDMVDFKYMADGQVSRTNYNYEGLAGNHEIAMVYNELRVPIGKDYKNSLNAGANFKWRSTLDNFGRTTRSNSIHNNVNTQTAQNYYDAVGNLLMVGVGTGVGVNNPHIDYQIIKKDIREQVVSQMGNFFRVGLTYNAGGNITNQYWSSELFDPATSSSSNINQYAYTYDKMNRLIGADYKQSTLNSNPFDYFDALSGNFPNDFSCFVNESDVVNFLAPLYTELQDNIDNGRNVDQSTDALAVVNQLQADYVANNIAFATMGRAQKDKFLGTFFDNCISLKLNIAAFEIYQANKVADNDHVDSLERYGGITVTRMKYITLLLGNFPFISNQDCVPNPNATAYGYLPDFVSPTASSNSKRYDAAYWYTDNGNMTQLNRNDGALVESQVLKTIQAYTYSNTLNNKLTGVTWTVGSSSPFTHNYGYDATGNLLTDPRNQVTAIDYSLYDDMPKAITQSGDTHFYRYFGGQRSVKVINDTDREYYIDEIVLAQDATVKSYQTANGYATPNNANGVDYFYNVKDWLGTNRVVISATGTIVNASDTYPYGKKLPGRNQFNSNYEGYRYQFTGHETDGETGYQYHGARYYNEELARYMSTDRFSEKFYHQSPYVYAGNMPINAIDVNGDSIRLDDSFMDDKGAMRAMKEFVNTAEGKDFIAKYAKAGQVIGGVKFEKDGEYHKKGINVDYRYNYKEGENGGGQTTFDYIRKKNPEGTIIGQTITVDLWKGKGWATDNYCFNTIMTIFHESFIHVNLKAEDFLDNGSVDYSNMTDADKERAGGIDRHFQHKHVVNEYEKNMNDPNALWPGKAFKGLKKIAKDWNLGLTDEELRNAMWDFLGGYKRPEK